MTAELRNLPHIASMAFNEPLMLEPAYARVFFCALAGQLGISRLTDAVSGDSLTAGEAPAALALSVPVLRIRQQECRVRCCWRQTGLR